MAESEKHVSVSGGQGVVVGDYATVFQSFAQSAPTISSFIRDAQFRSLVDDRTRGFVGRDFVFGAIERAFADDDFPSGYIVIRGEPGIGKTALASMLVLRRGCVHHFNVAPENIRTPRQFLENVCAQLIARFELDYSTLPASAGEDGGFLVQLLRDAAEKAGNRDELPVVVVVDALDEAEDTGLAPGANRLYLPPTLPPGVFFVITTREEKDYRLNVDNERLIWIQDDDPENARDIARYIEGFIGERTEVMHQRIHDWGVEVADFVVELVQLSEGNFMYLVYVLPEIERGRLSRETVGSVDGLPQGLQGYYMRHWREMKDLDSERFKRLQRPVLCFLAVSREPIALTQITEWTRLEPGEVKRVVGEWREFLNEDLTARPPLYRIYHRSFAEFLDEEEDLRWYHGQIADAALAKIPGFLEG